MALLDGLAGRETVIVLPRLDVDVRVGAEEMSVDFGVDGRLAGPFVPDVVAQGVRDELPFFAAVFVVHAHGRRLGVGILGRVDGLGVDHAEMFAPEVSAQRGGVEAGLERFAVHGRLEGSRVGHDDGELAVVRAELGPVVQVARTADDRAVVGDEQLRVDVQLLLDKVGFFLFGLAFPWFLGDEAAAGHGVFGDRVCRRHRVFDVDLVPRSLELSFAVDDAFLLVLADTVAGAVSISFLSLPFVAVDATAHDLFGFGALELLVGDAGFLFLLDQSWGFVDAVVRAQVEDEDVLGRIEPGGLDLSHDAVFATVDRLVLVVHDGSGAYGRVVAQVTRKSWNGRDDDDDAELPAFFASTNACIDDGTADCVVYRVLFLASRGNEELVFNVDVMLGVLDDFGIGVLDAVVVQNPARPVVTAANNLRVYTARVLETLAIERAEWMLDVLTNRVLGPLNGD